MDDKRPIKITSSSADFIESNIVLGKEKFLFITETDVKDGKTSIVTKTYSKGELMSTRKTPLGETKAGKKELGELMQKQHTLIISLLREEKTSKMKAASSYLNDAKEFLRLKKYKDAFHELEEALRHYPDEPFLASYYGYLDAKLQKNYQQGINNCKKAIETLHAKVPFGVEFFYPVLYLNLGRAYLAAGRRKDAVSAFRKGLAIDKENKELIWELTKLGVRKKPVFPFLSRENPLNKFTGILRSKLIK